MHNNVALPRSMDVTFPNISIFFSHSNVFNGFQVKWYIKLKLEKCMTWMHLDTFLKQRDFL
jgi:hypothetical protein